MSTRSTVRALPTLMRIGFAEAVAYRAEFLVWLLSTNMSLVMLAIWHAVAADGPVGRFDQREFTAVSDEAPEFGGTDLSRHVWLTWPVAASSGALRQSLGRSARDGSCPDSCR